MKKATRKLVRSRWSKAKLKALIDEAVVDAHDESEQQMGFYTAIEDNVRFPFQVTLFGTTVTVEGLSLSESEEIVGVCIRGSEKRSLPILSLPLPDPPPKGTEWIEAYRLWKNP